MTNLDRFRVDEKHLRWKCDPASLGFKTTREIESSSRIIGQDRALSAIRLGLELKSPGYNVYISGLIGTGKTTSIRRVLEGMDLRRTDLQDICYVTNFKTAESPVCLYLPAGKGCELKRSMKEVLGTIREYIPAVYKNERFKERQAKILAGIKERKDNITQEFEKEIQKKGFALVEVEYGQFSRPEIAPVVGGEIVSMDQLPALLVQGKLGRGDYDKLQESHPGLMEKLETVLTASRELQQELSELMSALEREYIQPVVAHALQVIQKKFNDDKVDDFLSGIEIYVMDHLSGFYKGNTDADDPARESMFLPFEVNVVVDNGDREEAPVVVEKEPTYSNLFGTIERRADKNGEISTDFTRIRSGSFMRANGGYLIVNITELFEEPYVWPTFKRAIKNQSYTIRSFDSLLLAPIASLKPEEVKLNLKVILIGDVESYQILHEHDEDFGRIFKIRSDFDSVMPNRRDNIRKYCEFIKKMCDDEALLPFHNTGVAAIIEEGVRLAGKQTKISAQFSEMGDIMREAEHWARKEKARSVRDGHVHKAMKERTKRSNLYEEKLQEMFADGTYLIDTQGEAVGQINGLAIYDFGDYAFGKPSRITAETGVGRAGIINIEREAEMSGRIHNKGVLILEGYLRRMYSQDKPLTMAASICFEQAYSGIDGDSASSTEVYALLSSLSEVPLRQGIAVTGSVNQKGEIQPIGGVNEKIEGYFDICRIRGLSGEQGVMIPALNKPDLMLRADVREAVAKKKFHIYAVKTIDEGIEVLTGRKAGRRLMSGGFSPGKVHDLVDTKLRRFHDYLRSAEEGDENKSDH